MTGELRTETSPAPAAGTEDQLPGPGWLPPPERFGEPALTWEGRPIEHWQMTWQLPVLLVFRRTTSTNDVARALADAGAPAGAVVLAEEQTAGRGRGGRAWTAPPGSSLLLSLVLRPAASHAGGDVVQVAPVAPLVAGVAVARAIETVTRLPAAIKWPNDILLGGRKVAGILCEAAADKRGGEYIVAGIGINVCQSGGDFSTDIAFPATSLELAAASPVQRAAVAAFLIERLRPLFDAPPGPLAPEALQELQRRDALFGHTIEVDGRIAGTACGIAPDGALMVRTPAGGRAEIRTGTVRAVS